MVGTIWGLKVSIQKFKSLYWRLKVIKIAKMSPKKKWHCIESLQENLDWSNRLSNFTNITEAKYV